MWPGFESWSFLSSGTLHKVLYLWTFCFQMQKLYVLRVNEGSGVAVVQISPQSDDGGRQLVPCPSLMVAQPAELASMWIRQW